ncbi:hypothetical protein DEAC_c18060 [Desulfosporosinus acididurans]|uniref:Uncharacterized protein n=2 Tax=Desulfosporosinus acididurans TaxID=476652 RepID=A0A0J1FSX6_9FIRM|nr:hypothetical protein DEAC_c18060 [Desulfosporosinus acididurans]
MFMPLSADWGEQAQVDWGRAKVYLHGKLTEVSLFCLRMKASLVPFVWAAPTEKLEAFLEGHKRAFEWLGGVPERLVYDNPKTAVTKILLLNLEYNFEDVLSAVEECLKQQTPTQESIRQLLNVRLSISNVSAKKSSESPLATLDVPVDTPSKFNHLMGGMTHDGAA